MARSGLATGEGKQGASDAPPEHPNAPARGTVIGLILSILGFWVPLAVLVTYLPRR
jgi:hypothetical protein